MFPPKKTMNPPKEIPSRFSVYTFLRRWIPPMITDAARCVYEMSGGKEAGNMTPTPYLRFVERENLKPIGINVVEVIPIRILQQWWSKDAGSGTLLVPQDFAGEWRDVPMEKE